MQIIETYQNVPKEVQNGIIAIGNFDGVHRGHQVVINTVKQIANKSTPCLPGVMFFNPHPRTFFQPDKQVFCLSLKQRKLELMNKLGMDFAIVLNFNKELAELSAEQFVKKVLIEGLMAKHVIIGFDFYFGKGRSGNASAMLEFGQQYGFEVTVVEEQKDNYESYSSTKIRELLQEGDVSKAAEMLGYWWRVSGIVESGAQKGSWLGFPTANISLLPSQRIGHGIYAVNVHIGTETYSGASYHGTRPTFDNGRPVLETFIFDFDGELYGKTIEIEFIEYIRKDEKFPDAESLKRQMQEDCIYAKELLSDIRANNSSILSI